MMRLSFWVLIIGAFAPIAVEAVFKSRSLRHEEKSVVVLSETDASDADIAKVPAPVQVRVPSSELQLVGSMGSFLESEQEVMDPKSPKAQLQRKLVSLIWLEKVLKQNLDSMDEAKYRSKIAQSKTGLEKDTTPATAEMLGRMRTEMHEFSVPFFQKAVQDELKGIHARQKAILDKIIALDAGEDVDISDDVEDEADEPKKKAELKEAAADSKPEKKADGGDKAAKDDEKKKRNRQSNMFVMIMSIIGGSLILIVLGIAIKVHTHTPSRS